MEGFLGGWENNIDMKCSNKNSTLIFEWINLYNLKIFLILYKPFFFYFKNVLFISPYFVMI